MFHRSSTHSNSHQHTTHWHTDCPAHKLRQSRAYPYTCCRRPDDLGSSENPWRNHHRRSSLFGTRRTHTHRRHIRRRGSLQGTRPPRNSIGGRLRHHHYNQRGHIPWSPDRVDTPQSHRICRSNRSLQSLLLYNLTSLARWPPARTFQMRRRPYTLDCMSSNCPYTLCHNRHHRRRIRSRTPPRSSRSHPLAFQ